jgi:hypothetical protein
MLVDGGLRSAQLGQPGCIGQTADAFILEMKFDDAEIARVASLASSYHL